MDSACSQFPHLLDDMRLIAEVQKRLKVVKTDKLSVDHVFAAVRRSSDFRVVQIFED